MTLMELAGAPLAAHLGVVLVLLGAAMAFARVRRELRPPHAGGRPARNALPDDGVGARVIEARGLATPEQVRAMTPRERQFLLDHATTLLGPGGSLRTPPRLVRDAEARPPHAAPRRAAMLHCPACGAAFGQAGQAPYVLASCPRCGRRVSAHRDGTRLVVAVDDASE